MRTHVGITVVSALWLISPSLRAEPKTPAEKEIEIRCPLPGSSAILSIVKDGARVKEGDLLVTLDNSNLRTDVERLRAEVVMRAGEMSTAKRRLQRAEAEIKRMEVAEFAVKVAELRCRAHAVELDMERKMIEREIAVAQKAFELLKRHVESLAASGGDSAPAAAELELLKAEAALETATNKKRLFEAMCPLKEAELELAKRQSELEFALMKRETAEELESAKASLAAGEQMQRAREDRLKRLEDLLSQSTVLAPSNGTVRHLKQGNIAEGIYVRERQPLLILIRE